MLLVSVWFIDNILSSSFDGSQGCSRLFKVHRMCNAALHHISVSMQPNARSTSCYYLSLVTGGCAVGWAHWVTDGPWPTGISCPLQSLYIKSLRKVKPQRERALSAASAAGGSGGIRCRNNPFMDFRYVLGLFRRVARWIWFFRSPGASRDWLLTLVGVFVLPMSCRTYCSIWGEQRLLQKPYHLSSSSPSLPFSVSAHPPLCLPKRSGSGTNSVQYICQSLNFPFTSTQSLVNPPLFHAAYILIRTSHFRLG